MRVYSQAGENGDLLWHYAFKTPDVEGSAINNASIQDGAIEVKKMLGHIYGGRNLFTGIIIYSQQVSNSDLQLIAKTLSVNTVAQSYKEPPFKGANPSKYPKK